MSSVNESSQNEPADLLNCHIENDFSENEPPEMLNCHIVDIQNESSENEPPEMLNYHIVNIQNESPENSQIIDISDEEIPSNQNDTNFLILYYDFLSNNDGNYKILLDLIGITSILYIVIIVFWLTILSIHFMLNNSRCSSDLTLGYQFILLFSTLISLIILIRKIRTGQTLSNIRWWYLISRLFFWIIIIIAINGIYHLSHINNMCKPLNLLFGIYISQTILGGFCLFVSIFVIIACLLHIIYNKFYNNIDKNSSVFNFENIPDQYRDDFCSICLEKFINTSKLSLRQIDTCQHIYHQRCIDQWLQNNRHCPLCRSSIRENNDQPIPVNTTISYPNIN